MGGNEGGEEEMPSSIYQFVRINKLQNYPHIHIYYLC